jgi:uridine kinase
MSLLLGNKVSVRKYDFMEQCLGDKVAIEPQVMIIVTGMHIFTRELIRKIPLDKSIKNYLDNIKPNFETYIEPTKKFCDMVIPNFGGGYSDNHGDIRIMIR